MSLLTEPVGVSHILIVGAVLFVVGVGGRFIGYLQDAAAGKIPADALLTILELRLPGFIQLLVPFAAFLSVLVTYGRLYADQEMAVLQSGGGSPTAGLRWMALPVLLVVLLEGWLSVHLTPQSNLAFTDYILEQRTRQQVNTLTPGVFNVISRGERVTYADGVSDDGRTLQGVFITEQKQGHPEVNIWAEQGEQYVDQETGSRFLLLSNGKRYEALPGQRDYRVIEFGQLGQRVLVEEASRDVTDSEAMPTADLLASGTAKDLAELHWRIALPLFTLVGILLAVGLSRVKPRQSRFARVLPGMGVVVLYYFALLINQNALREGDVPAWLGYWLVHILFLGLAVFLIRRVGQPVRA